MTDQFQAQLGRLVELDSVSPVTGERLARAGALLAELGYERHAPTVFVRGNPEAEVWLYGHLDTKPPVPRAAWRFDPFTLTESDGRWYGLGVSDSKFQLLNAALVMDPASQFMLVDLEEECQGLEAGRLLASRRVDFLVVVDGSVGNHDVYRGLSGQADGHFVLRTGATPGHPGREPSGAGGPKLLDLIHELTHELESSPFRFNLTGLQAPATERSLTLEEVTVRFDIRFTRAQERAVKQFLDARSAQIRQWMPAFEGRQPLPLDGTVPPVAPFSSNLGLVDDLDVRHVLVVPGALPENGNHRPNEFIYPWQIERHRARLSGVLHKLKEVSSCTPR